MNWIKPELFDGQPPLPQNKAMRLLRHPLVLLIIGFIAISAAMSAGFIAAHAIPGNPVGRFAAGIVIAALTVAAYYLFVHYVEGARFIDFATYRAPRELAGGLLLGAGLFALITGVVALMGGYRILSVNSWVTILPMLGMAIHSGVGEEILFRGILFRFIEKMGGSYVALITTAAAFGGAHLANPNATPLAAIAIAIEAGILLGALYMLTRRLWAAIGMHAAWNFTQGWVFGIPVSGFSDAGLVRSERPGPEWLTGGQFGLEASVVAMVLATATGLALLELARRRGQVRWPGGRRYRTSTEEAAHPLPPIADITDGQN